MSQSASQLQAVRGMNDLLPGAVSAWQRVEAAIRTVTAAYGYAEIRPPVVERTELFKRSIGEQTDIVEKEMYTFTDTGGASLTLRPEATASCVRVGIEHGLFYNNPVRLWYLGPMFRHERPQKGRYRQFHQFGVEAVGWRGPDVDAEIIVLSARLWRALGVRRLQLQVNTLGGPAVRAGYRDALVAYFGRFREHLDDDSRRRLDSNPLRILDSKHPPTQEIVAGAPALHEYLDDATLTHFDGLKQLLAASGIEFTVNPRLVRGLDYYTGPVFEWLTDRLGTQNAVCAGGRYDGLVEQLGGRAAPAAGFALGMERLIELVCLDNPAMGDVDAPDAYLATAGENLVGDALALAERLRAQGLTVINHCGGGALKRQLKRADRSGARFALVLGNDELQRGVVTVKALRAEAAQQQVPLANLGNFLLQATPGRGTP